MNRNLLLAAGLLFTACQTRSASEYSTQQMYAYLNVEARTENSAVVSAQFTPAPISSTFLQLTSADRLQARVDSQTVTLDELSLLGAVSYSATLPLPNPEAEVHFSLSRESDSGAPDSFVKLPPPLTLNPLPKGRYSRSAEFIEASWSSASQAQTEIVVTGECLRDFKASVTGTGGPQSFRIAPSLLEGKDGPVSGSCSAELKVSHVSVGTVDSNFRGGNVRAAHTRSATFTSDE